MTASGLNYWITIGVKDEATGPFAGIAKAMGEISRAAQEAGGAFKDLGAAGSRHVQEVGEGAKGVSAALNEAAAAAAATGDAIAKASDAGEDGLGRIGDATVELTKGTKALSKAAKELGEAEKTAGDKGAESLDKAAGAGERARGVFGRLSGAMRDLAKEGEKLKKLGEAFDRLKGMGTGLMAAGGAMMAPAAGSAYKAMAAETRKLAIERPFIGADGRNKLDPYRAQAEAAAAGTGMGRLDALDMLAGTLTRRKAAGLGTDGHDLTQALDASAKLSMVHGISGKDAADLLAGVSVGYKVKDEEQKDLANYLNSAAQASGTSFQAMATLVAGLDNRAGNMGIDGIKGAKSVALMATAFKGAGMGDEEAGGAIDTLLRTAPMLGFKQLHGDGAVAEMVKKAIGGEDGAAVGAVKLKEITKGIFGKDGKLKGEDGGDKMLTVVELFDRLSKSIKNDNERLQVFSALLPGAKNIAGLAANVDAWDKAAAAINDHNSLERQAADVADTATHKWAELRAATGGLAVSIGDRLLPAAKWLLETATGVIEKIKAWTEEHPALTKALALATVGVGALAAAAGGALWGIGLLGSTTKGISGWAKWGDLLTVAKTKVVELGNASLIASAKTKLLDMGGGFKRGFKDPRSLFRKGDGPGFWAGAKKSTDRLRSGIRVGAKRALGGVKALGKGSTWSGMGKGLMGAGKGLLGAGKTALLLPFKALGGVFAGIAALGWPVVAVIAAIAGAALLVYKYWEPIKAFFQGVWSGIKKGADSFKEPWEKLKGAVKGIWNAFASIVRIFIPVKAGQDEANGAMNKGVAVGEALAKVLGWICTGATWVARYLEGVVFAVVTLVDTIVAAGKTIWYALTGQWGKIGDSWKDMGKRTADRWRNLSWQNAQEDKALAAAANTEATASEGRAKKAEKKALEAEDEARKLRKEAERLKADAKAAEAKARKTGAEADVKAAQAAEARAKEAEDRAKRAENTAKAAQKNAANAKNGGPVQKAKTTKERIEEAKRKEEQERRIAENRAKWAAMTPEERKAWQAENRAKLHAKFEAERAAKEEEAKAPLKAATEEAAAAKARHTEAEGKAAEAKQRLDALRAKDPKNMDAIARARVTWEDARADANARKDELTAAQKTAAQEWARENVRQAEEQVANTKEFSDWSGFGKKRAAKKALEMAQLQLAGITQLTGADATQGAAATNATGTVAATGATDSAAAGDAVAPAASGGTTGAAPGQAQAIQPAQTVQNTQTNTTTINYSPSITLPGNATPDDERRFSALLKKHKEELAKLVNEVNERNRRWTGAA